MVGARCLLALLSFSLVVCSKQAETPTPNTARDEIFARSSSILYLEDATPPALWVTSPDDDRVVVIDPESLEVTASMPSGKRPEQLARAERFILVTHAGDENLTLITLESDNKTTAQTIATPCGGTRGVVAFSNDRSGPKALVTCPDDAALLLVDLESAGILARIDAPARATAIAVARAHVYVTSSHQGFIARFALSEVLDARSDASSGESVSVESEGIELGEGTLERSFTQLDALAFDDRPVDELEGGKNSIFAAFQLVDNDSMRDRPPERGGYGAIFDGDARIEPRLLGDCVGRYATFQTERSTFSGPSALAFDAANNALWVVHMFTQNVARFDCKASSQDAIDAVWRVGPGARGIAISKDGDRAFVDVGFDHAIARLDLADASRPTPTLTRPSLVKRRETDNLYLDDLAARGRILFHDATDVHMTPSGVVTCATCHPAGGDDGITWFIHTEGTKRKLRRTAPAWNARAQASPFHWDGEFVEASELVLDTIRELMEGDALLVDPYAIAAYMDQVPTPPGKVLTEASRARALRGRAVFESAGCRGCHSGASYTNNTFQSVAPASNDPDAVMEQVVVRPLAAVRARAPYLHDGRAPTLRSIHRDHNPNDTHGVTSNLSPEELEDLALYLETL